MESDLIRVDKKICIERLRRYMHKRTMIQSPEMKLNICCPPCNAHTSTSGSNNFGSRITEQSDLFSLIFARLFGFMASISALMCS
uniref:CSON015283 protein n=1 Tax=Culicoides sonorensis TaxID=179676 RepID=A0A336MFJ4_CULSO